MHTEYFRYLFEEENLKDVVLKLNGKAELFFRPPSIKLENAIVHKKGDKKTFKRDENKHRDKNENYQYDITKDKRYTEDKFFFHLSITLNFKEKDIGYLNQEILKFLKQNGKDVNIIGIDRGERHLLYYTLINKEGEIKKQGSLNKIPNDKNPNFL